MSKLANSGLDPAFLKAVRDLPCLGCGRDPPNEAHHIKSRGAGGKDDFFNCIPLCTDCHTQGPHAWHRVGANSFILRHPWVGVYMKQLGWSFINNRLIPPIKTIDDYFEYQDEFDDY